MKAVSDIIVSDAEAIGAFNTGVDAGSLQRPTRRGAQMELEKSKGMTMISSSSSTSSTVA